ncbi:uncharacterized protein LOC104441062 [Eucalyptus grandis]|uniref:uncharacterized protein LOC104441062 n=1 Tax=Eucalyptus grandis TaxID=71139 RepID=UPI00192EF26D|nr:uncharacterized protein LOC104441062 [Eucalyptus grandis]
MEFASVSVRRSTSIVMFVLMMSASLEAMAEAGTTSSASLAKVKRERVTCNSRRSRCFMRYVTCPVECPQVKPKDPKAKACYLDCYTPKCEAVCRKRKPNCSGMGAACYDPRFVGGDNIVFYFHGRSEEHYALVSDTDLQVNARFIGLRPVGRSRDFTWIQALGLLFGPHTFTLEAARAETWSDDIDRLRFSYDGTSVTLPESLDSEWSSPGDEIKLERTASKNSVTLIVQEALELYVSVVPITEEDDRIHSYGIPRNDSFAHLEVQFRFFGLSPRVDGVLGRTYRADFENPAKPGVEMAVVGGEDRYRTSSLLSSDCAACVFAPGDDKEVSFLRQYAMLSCTSGVADGIGMVCRK